MYFHKFVKLFEYDFFDSAAQAPLSFPTNFLVWALVDYIYFLAMIQMHKILLLMYTSSSTPASLIMLARLMGFLMTVTQACRKDTLDCFIHIAIIHSHGHRFSPLRFVLRNQP